MRIELSETSTKTVKRTRWFSDCPTRIVRSSYKASSSTRASGSPKTVTASANETPCFLRFEMAFFWSHENCTETRVIHLSGSGNGFSLPAKRHPGLPGVATGGRARHERARAEWGRSFRAGASWPAPRARFPKTTRASSSWTATTSRSRSDGGTRWSCRYRPARRSSSCSSTEARGATLHRTDTHRLEPARRRCTPRPLRSSRCEVVGNPQTLRHRQLELRWRLSSAARASLTNTRACHFKASPRTRPHTSD